MKKFLFLFFALTITAGFTAAQNTPDDDKFADKFLANYATTFYNIYSGGFPSNDANIVLQTTDGSALYFWIIKT